MANFQYIPGVSRANGKGIPWMTQAFEQGQFRGGVNARIIGFRSVERNLNIAIAKIVGKTTIKGLEAAADYLHKDMLTTSPTIPMKTGKLRDSWYKKSFITELQQPAVETGFEAGYTLFVHEMTPDAYGHEINWSYQGSGAKFFEYALKRNKKQLLSIIAAPTSLYLLQPLP